jgi:hypothetical protein
MPRKNRGKHGKGSKSKEEKVEEVELVEVENTDSDVDDADEVDDVVTAPSDSDDDDDVGSDSDDSDDESVAGGDESGGTQKESISGKIGLRLSVGTIRTIFSTDHINHDVAEALKALNALCEPVKKGKKGGATKTRDKPDFSLSELHSDHQALYKKIHKENQAIHRARLDKYNKKKAAWDKLSKSERANKSMPKEPEQPPDLRTDLSLFQRVRKTLQSRRVNFGSSARAMLAIYYEQIIVDFIKSAAEACRRQIKNEGFAPTSKHEFDAAGISVHASGLATVLRHYDIPSADKLRQADIKNTQNIHRNQKLTKPQIKKEVKRIRAEYREKNGKKLTKEKAESMVEKTKVVKHSRRIKQTPFRSAFKKILKVMREDELEDLNCKFSSDFELAFEHVMQHHAAVMAENIKEQIKSDGVRTVNLKVVRTQIISTARYINCLTREFVRDMDNRVKEFTALEKKRKEK